jgi:hypothetical protein
MTMRIAIRRPVKLGHPVSEVGEGVGGEVWPQRLIGALPLFPVAVSMVVLAVALLPEVTIAVPSLNDDAAHYSLSQNASRAIDAGKNPVDHWAPDLEFGFPQFAYYQHLPHLFVVGLHRFLFRQVDLLTLFNLTRYVLMVAFPITVYWSLRQLGFSRPAAATAATFAPLFSAGHRFGIEYDSYVWRGFGMYTQLWGMHLSFLAFAFAHRTMRDGRGYLATALVLTALVLSHVIYAFIVAITLPMLLLSGATRANFRQCTIRLLLAGVPAVLATAYFTVPLVLNGVYHATSPYMEDWKYNSHGAATVLDWLVTGKLFDYNRPPVISIVVATGVAVALWTRTRMALFALAMTAFWLVAYFGRPTLGPIADVLSFDGRLWMHRFIGPVQIGAIFLVAIAAGWMWTKLEGWEPRWPRIKTLMSRRYAVPALFAALMLLAAIPALTERWLYLDRNRDWMNETQASLEDDHDLASIIDRLETLPSGRVFAGLRDGFGDQMKHGSVRVPDVLTFHQIETAAPPYQSLTLNSDLIWHFDFTKLAHYDILNARYFIAPADLTVPSGLQRLMETERYTLYEAPSSGYLGLGVTPVGYVGSQEDFFIAARTWFLGRLPESGIVPAFAFDGTPRLEGIEYAPMDGASSALRRLTATDAPESLGTISSEHATAYEYGATVDVAEPATLFLKATYHPDWHAYVDGKEVELFMAAPSYPAVTLTPGEHSVRFEYKPNALRTPLLIFGAGVLLAVGVIEYRYVGRRDDATIAD